MDYCPKLSVQNKYDYIGKAEYILQLCNSYSYNPQEICFVGNSINNEYVSASGVRLYVLIQTI